MYGYGQPKLMEVKQHEAIYEQINALSKNMVYCENTIISYENIERFHHENFSYKIKLNEDASLVITIPVTNDIKDNLYVQKRAGTKGHYTDNLKHYTSLIKAVMFDVGQALLDRFQVMYEQENKWGDDIEIKIALDFCTRDNTE